jgi:hypothetical protein
MIVADGDAIVGLMFWCVDRVRDGRDPTRSNGLFHCV